MDKVKQEFSHTTILIYLEEQLLISPHSSQGGPKITHSSNVYASDKGAVTS